MKDVTLVWKGVEYRIEAREVLPVVAKIEECLTLFELADMNSVKKVKLARLSMAFGIALRHAGARVTDDEVHSGMFEAGNQRVAAESAVAALLTLMVPPEHLQEKPDGKKKAEPAAGGVSLSKKHTKRQSVGN